MTLCILSQDNQFWNYTGRRHTIFILLCADDIVLIADNEADRQKAIDKVESFCEQVSMYGNTYEDKLLRKRICKSASLQVSRGNLI